MNGHSTNGDGRAHATKLTPETVVPGTMPVWQAQTPVYEGELGAVTGGSLSGGLEVRLDASVAVQDMVVGNYVTIEAGDQRFFGMITDVELQTTMQKLAQTPP